MLLTGELPRRHEIGKLTAMQRAVTALFGDTLVCIGLPPRSAPRVRWRMASLAGSSSDSHKLMALAFILEKNMSDWVVEIYMLMK
jgi:hypothetical protein